MPILKVLHQFDRILVNKEVFSTQLAGFKSSSLKHLSDVVVSEFRFAFDSLYFTITPRVLISTNSKFGGSSIHLFLCKFFVIHWFGEQSKCSVYALLWFGSRGTIVSSKLHSWENYYMLSNLISVFLEFLFLFLEPQYGSFRLFVRLGYR